MGRGSSRSNPPRPRKRVEAETASTLKRARDGSAFTRWYGPFIPLLRDDFRKTFKEANPDNKSVAVEKEGSSKEEEEVEEENED
ncbi:hypothetical protein B296_00030633 [Ensete ventricosum]|uniref:Uncharacterized protein n=1 Tax=Ensete ventricosum TaxID=4639 RepID=A0A427A6S6_ENSVE|nr:hypothetical protein B296_00030633 [Ensete ventricosum]